MKWELVDAADEAERAKIEAELDPAREAARRGR